MLLVPKEHYGDGQAKQSRSTSDKPEKASAMKVPGKYMAMTVRGLSMILQLFTVCGTTKSVLWMKGCHLPLANKIRNNHLFHDVPAQTQLTSHKHSFDKSLASMSPTPLRSPHNELFCLHLLFYLSGKSVVSLLLCFTQASWGSCTALCWTARMWAKGRSLVKMEQIWSGFV